MSALSDFMYKLLPFLEFNVKFTRKYLPMLFFIVSIGGSLLKELDVVPSSYFSNRRNLLNVYFVKLSWGWNLSLLVPFIFFFNSYKRNLIFMSKRLASLVVATAIWHVCTETFFYIENITGTCYESDNMQMVQEGFSTKAKCKDAGYFWEGFDISGHCFILSYSTLLIMEETVPMLHLVQHFRHRSTILDVLYLALNVIALIWVWMFICTSVYFHNIIQKFLGTLFGVLGWFGTYKVWYLNPFSPGLPPYQRDHKQHK